MRALKVVCLLAAWIVSASCASASAAEPAKKNPALGKVRHVVVFKFKAEAKAEDIKKVEDAFRELPKKIDGIEGYEWGTNMSPEKLAGGFTHCFLLTFKDAKARDAYLPHPAHKAFGKILRPHLEKAFVIDYVAQE